MLPTKPHSIDNIPQSGNGSAHILFGGIVADAETNGTAGLGAQCPMHARGAVNAGTNGYVVAAGQYIGYATGVYAVNRQRYDGTGFVRMLSEIGTVKGYVRQRGRFFIEQTTQVLFMGTYFCWPYG